MSDDPLDISQEADETLAALAAASGGEGLVSARQDASNLLVSKGPDVLWTPKGGGKKAVAYSVVAPMNPSIRLSTSVRNNGNYDFQLNSRTTTIQGHKPGTLKGVKLKGYQKYSHVEVGADYLFSEGFANVSHRDPAWINRDEEGPTEPHREASTQFVAFVPGQASSASPYGALRGSQNPPGSPYGALPTEVPTTSTPTIQTPFGPPSVPISAMSRDGGSPDQSSFQRNAIGETNVESVKPSSKKFPIRLMSDISKEQKMTPDQAAGFIGNFSKESIDFTAFHQMIGGRSTGTRYREAPVDVGARGVGQWDFERRIEFKKLISQRKHDNLTDDQIRNHEYSDADYRDYGNNNAMVQHELNTPNDQGGFQDVANSVKNETGGVPDWAHNMQIDGKSYPSVADSTWRVFSQYEKPRDYGNYMRVVRHRVRDPRLAEEYTDAAKANFRDRFEKSKAYLDEYRTELAKTGGG